MTVASISHRGVFGSAGQPPAAVADRHGDRRSLRRSISAWARRSSSTSSLWTCPNLFRKVFITELAPRLDAASTPAQDSDEDLSGRRPCTRRPRPSLRPTSPCRSTPRRTPARASAADAGSAAGSDKALGDCGPPGGGGRGADEFARYYPEQALRRDLAGKAVLSCLVAPAARCATVRSPGRRRRAKGSGRPPSSSRGSSP